MRTLLLVVALATIAAASCPLCTKEQCAKTLCTVGTNSYACLAGIGAGGCAGNESAWSNKEICSECCKVDSCVISCPACDAAACANYTCPQAASFVCTQGSAAGGCGTSQSWTDTPLCKKCCNTAHCSKPTTQPTVPPHACRPCPASICNSRPLPCPRNFPGVCLEGPSKGGCSTAQGFSNSSTCSSCCDSTNCYTNPSFNCTHPCGTELCHAPLRCQVSQQFMCTEGPNKYGCSNSASFWPTLPSGCSGCCDVKTCVRPCAEKCTPEQCQLAKCPASASYVCTSGPLTKGCGTKDYFPTQPTCYSCCNTQSCA